MGDISSKNRKHLHKILDEFWTTFNEYYPVDPKDPEVIHKRFKMGCIHSDLKAQVWDL